MKKKALVPKQLRHWCKKAGFVSENNTTLGSGLWKHHYRKAYSQDYVFFHRKTYQRIRFLYHLEAEFEQGKRCTWEPNRTDIGQGRDDFDRWANSVAASVPKVPRTEKECHQIIARLLMEAGIG